MLSKSPEQNLGTIELHSNFLIHVAMKLYSNGISESLLWENDIVLGQHLESHSVFIAGECEASRQITSPRSWNWRGGSRITRVFLKSIINMDPNRLCFSDRRKAAEYTSECQP